jgi:hypothetical protein
MQRLHRDRTLPRSLCAHLPIQDPGWTACGPARRRPRCLTPLDSVTLACPHRSNANSVLIEATAGGGDGEETCKDHAGRGINCPSDCAQNYSLKERAEILIGSEREKAFLFSISLTHNIPSS